MSPTATKQPTFARWTRRALSESSSSSWKCRSSFNTLSGSRGRSSSPISCLTGSGRNTCALLWICPSTISRPTSLRSGPALPSLLVCPGARTQTWPWPTWIQHVPSSTRGAPSCCCGHAPSRSKSTRGPSFCRWGLPDLECWVMGYSDDSGSPQESTYLPGQFMNMPPNPTMKKKKKKTITTVMRNDPTRKLFLLTSSFLLPSSSCHIFKI